MMKKTAAFLALFLFASSIYAENIIRVSAPIKVSKEAVDPPKVEEPKIVGYQILNPVSGVNGVYTIKSEYGSDFQAYVDMTRDGGNWILHTKWSTLTPTSRFFSEVVQSGSPMTTFSNTPDTHPVIPSGMMNSGTDFMFVSENAQWRTMAGDWQVFHSLPANYALNSAGFEARSSGGTLTKLFHPRAGWRESLTMTTATFGLFTVWGAGSACGGANTSGKSACPVMRNTTASGGHYDQSSNKYLFIKSNN